MAKQHPHQPYITREGLAHVPGATNSHHDLDIPSRALSAELDRLIGEAPIDMEKAKALAQLFVDRLPLEMRAGLTSELDTFKEHLAQEVLTLTGQSSTGKIELTEAQIADAIMKIQLELMVHHANGIKLQAAVHEFDGQPPEKVEKHFVHSGRPFVLRAERVGKYITLTISAVTSAMGGRHMAGGWIEDARNKFPLMKDVLQDPTLQEVLADIFGVASAAFVTLWALRTFKEELTKIAFSADDKTLARSGLQVLGEKFRGSLGSKLVGAAFIGALGYDLVSNMDGVITMTKGSLDDAEQLATAEADIDAQKAAIRSQLAGLPENVRDQVMVFANTEIHNEQAGTSASKKGGTGPMYYAKVALLTDEALGTSQLSTVAGQSGTWGTIGKQVDSSIRGSGLIDDSYQNIGAHFLDVTKTSTDAAEVHLGNIDSLEASLDPTSGTAMNQARIEKIQKEFDEIVALVGTDGKMKGDLNTALEKYNQALNALGQVANAHKDAYPNFSAGEIGTVDLPDIKVDLSKIEIKSVTFKSTFELAQELQAEGKYVEAAFWIALALGIAILMSYGNDVLFGEKVRKTHVEDRKRVADEEAEFSAPARAGLTNLFDVLMNGMYMKTGKTEPIHPQAIGAVVIDYCKEQAEASKPKGWWAEHRAALGDPSLTGHTEEANDFNIAQEILRELFNGPEAMAHFRAMRDRMLPNLKLLEEIKTTSGVKGEVVRTNNDLLKDQNVEIEDQEMTVLEREVPILKGTDARKTLFEKMQKSRALLEVLNNRIRATKDLLNTEKRTRIKDALSKAWPEGEALMEAHFVKAAEAIEVEAKALSIREARATLAAMDAELAAYKEQARRGSKTSIKDFATYEGAKAAKIGEIAIAEAAFEREEARNEAARRTEAEYLRFKDGNDALSKELEGWWDEGRAEEDTAEHRANALLKILKSDKIISGPEAVDMSAEDAAFHTLKRKLQGLVDSANANGDTEKALEIGEWMRRLDRAMDELNKFVTRI